MLDISKQEHTSGRAIINTSSTRIISSRHSGGCGGGGDAFSPEKIVQRRAATTLFRGSG